MTNKEIENHIDKQGTKITKEKLLDSIKKSTDKEFWFRKDNTSTYAIIRVKISWYEMQI